MKLRDYQQAAVAAAVREFASRKSTLIELPTGTGKTVVFAHLADQMQNGKRVMVVAHRGELLKQAGSKIHAVTGHAAEVEKAESWASADIDTNLGWASPYVVASIQTLTSGEKGARRMQRFRPEDFSLLVIDEAHHAPAATYREAVEWFGANPDLKILGVTATGDRGDGQGLGCVFDSVAYEYALPDAVRDGWLVPVRQKMVTIDGLDFSTCRTTAGDLNSTDLAAVMEFESTLHPVAHATLEIACGFDAGFLASLKDLDNRIQRIAGIMGSRKPRHTLVFASSVGHAERLAEIFNRWIDGCARFICGKTPDEERDGIMADYASGKYSILVNVGVCTEGFDVPQVELVVMARPTKSRSLYAQMLGRGTRPADSLAPLLGEMLTPTERRASIEESEKPYAEVLDFVGNCGKHKLVTAIDILVGTDAGEELADRAKEIFAENGGDVEGAIADAESEIELDQAANRLKAEKEAEALREADETRLLADIARRTGLVGTTNYEVRDVNDSYDSGASGASYRRNRATDKQIALLLKFGVRSETASEYSKSQASAVIGKLKMQKCTGPQASFLRRRGYKEADIKSMNFDSASAAIQLAVAEAA